LLLCAALLPAASACTSTAPNLPGGPAPAVAGAAAGEPATCAILSVNDTYRMEPSPDRTGGMARVRTLRRRLEEQYPDLVMLHAGDFLFPSLLSRQYLGAQMIDVMNHMDGSDAFDPRLLVTFGNHELDDDRASVLTARLGESAFRWVSSNIEFARTPAGLPAVATQKIARR
jgi:2',3'-cyclic-nucleotide 2'-phosphodiesterase (5'-nucleotidase family)